MTMAKKVGNGTLLVAAVLGAFLCFGSMFGVWFAKPRIDSGASALIATLEGYAELALQNMQQVDSVLASAQQTVDNVNQATQQLATSNDRRPIIAVIERSVREDLLLRLERLVQITPNLHATIISTNRQLEQLNAAMPFLSVPTFGEELAQLDTQITAVSSQVQSLIAAIKSADARKQQAIAEYRSLFQVDAGDRLLTLYEVEDQYVGRLFGVAYAEPFRSHSPLLIDDLTVFKPGLHG